MNERIRQAIIDNAVKPLLKSRLSDMTGTIIKTYYNDNSFDPESANRNAVDVEITIPFSGETQVLGMVPIATNGLMGGVDGARLKVGDKVIVSFQGGDGNYPRIIAKVYDNPEERNLEMKAELGNNIPDFYSAL